jgi:SAM-dependent methyltransferase
MANDGIRMEEVTTCLFCQKGGEPLYTGLPDRLFGAPGIWGFWRCPDCGLVWLNPRPVPEDLGKVYTTYYTHSDGDRCSRLALLREKIDLALIAAIPGYHALAPGMAWRHFGRVLSLFPPMREDARLATMCLDGIKTGRLLDVGCGNGRFLAIMRDAGWEVLGVEPDAASAKIAKERFGVPVIVGTLAEAGMPDESFDAVSLSHVIEHVYDPVALLAECRRVLKLGSKLVVLTPNIESLGHEQFGDSWRGLEPPRHLYLFSLGTLRACAEKGGLRIVLLRTSSRIARYIWVVSQVIKKRGRFSDSDITWRLRFGGLAFRIREEITRLVREPKGEELVLIGVRDA